MTNDKENPAFFDFKTKLRTFEDPEKFNVDEPFHDVMKISTRTEQRPSRERVMLTLNVSNGDWRANEQTNADTGRGAAIAKGAHNETMCRQTDKQGGVKRSADERGNRSRAAAADYVIRMEDADTQTHTSKSSMSQDTALRKKVCWWTTWPPHTSLTHHLVFTATF